MHDNIERSTLLTGSDSFQDRISSAKAKMTSKRRGASNELILSYIAVLGICLFLLISVPSNLVGARSVTDGRQNNNQNSNNHHEQPANHNQAGTARTGRIAKSSDGTAYEVVDYPPKDNSVPKSVLPNRNHQDRCAPGWMWFNDKCLVATQSRRDFQHATELCKKLYQNSTLPTIHSAAENEFLRTHINLHDSPIWLNARHNHQYNKTRWLDRSQPTFTYWDKGQPNDKSSLICIKTEDNWYMKKTDNADGQTECVSFWEDGTWGTQVGCSVLLPVVCQSKLDMSGNHNMNRTPAGAMLEQSSMLSSAHSIAQKGNNLSIMMSMPYIATILTSSSYLIQNYLSLASNFQQISFGTLGNL